MSATAVTVAEMVAQRSQIHPDREFMRAGDRSMTYGQLLDRSEAVATGLLSAGAELGSRIGVLSGHTLELWELLFACARLGSVPVLVNTRLAIPEIDAILADAEVVMVFSSDEFRSLVPTSTSLADFTRRCKSAAELPPAPGPDDDLVQLYTSGTTGMPKGVRTTNQNMVELLTVLATEVPGMGCDSVHLVAAPSFHIAGYGYGLAGLRTGAASVLIPEFDPVEVLRNIETHHCTSSLLVPAMLQAVVDHPEVARCDLSSMRSILYGGSPMPEILMRRVVECFEVEMTQAYGLTETTGFATLLRWDDHRAGLGAEAGSPAAEYLASAGYPVPGTEIRIAAESGGTAQLGFPGEVLARGPTVMAGYWNRADLNAEVIQSDGWFHTGDVGYIEDGRLFLVDRLGDKIVTKGENVFPGEVERVIAELPEVAEVAIVGVPDDEFGERICAVIGFRTGASLTLDDIRDACGGEVARYKLPRRLVVAREPLPRTPSGKVQRRLVREPFWAQLDRRVN